MSSSSKPVVWRQGSTAGSLGAILPEPDAWYAQTEPLAGKRSTRLGWKSAQKGAAELAAAIRKLGIKCDLKSAPYLINARLTDEVSTLRREQAISTSGRHFRVVGDGRVLAIGNRLGVRGHARTRRSVHLRPGSRGAGLCRSG
jgi:hypothetical protein